jgi:hypothetical protein
MNDSLSQQETDELLIDMSQQVLLTQELAKMKQGESSMVKLNKLEIWSLQISRFQRNSTS